MTWMLVKVAIVVIGLVYVLPQVRKPDRWLGRLFLWSMNRSHSALTDWGLSHLRVGREFTILDVGCGGGRTIQKLAAMAGDGRVSGIDYAAGSVAASRALNAGAVAAGRVEIRHGSVSKLPWPDRTFDLVTAVETLYYWPDPASDMREVCRVLKPGGTVAVIAESYAGGGRGAVDGIAMKLLGASHLTPDQNRELFERAGLSNVQVFEEPGKRWLCVTGSRPVA
jgi:SAM-dependent methyltransferase